MHNAPTTLARIAAPADAKHVEPWVDELGDGKTWGRYVRGTRRATAGVELVVCGWQDADGGRAARERVGDGHAARRPAATDLPGHAVAHTRHTCGGPAARCGRGRGPGACMPRARPRAAPGARASWPGDTRGAAQCPRCCAGRDSSKPPPGLVICADAFRPGLAASTKRPRPTSQRGG